MFDVQALLAGLTLSAEDRGVISDLFTRNTGVVEDISSKINAYIDTSVGSVKTDLDDKRAELEAEWTALRSYRGADEDVVAQMEQKIERLTSKVAVAESRLETTARRAGLDPEPLLKDIREAAPAAKVVPNVESTMNADEILRQSGKFAWNAVEMTAALYDVDREHQRLFGTPIGSATEFIKELTQEATRTNNRNLTPLQFAEKKFNFAGKRAEQQEAAIVAREKAAADKALETYKSEQALRVQTTGNPDPAHVPSPIFGSLTKDQSKPVQIAGVSDAVSAAILDFRQRKVA